jgi:hypothetical protein
VAVHEGGWSYRREADGSVRWFRPDGSLFDPRVRAAPVFDTS